MLPAPQTPGMAFSGTGRLARTFVRVQDIKGGVICLNLGEKVRHYRSVLQVNTINFGLMAETDQDALIEGFKAFLNGLSFPIQILIKNLPYRLDDYIQAMEGVQGELAEMAHDHARFVRELASKRALVKRVFYVIVPSDHNPLLRNHQESLTNAQTQLKLRIEELLRQLERLGLSGHRLTDEEIIALYQNSFISEEARIWPLTPNLVAGANNLMLPSKEIQSNYDPAELAAISETSEVEEQIARKARQKREKEQQKKKSKIPDFVSIPDLITPCSIQIYPWYIRIDGEATHEYLRTLAIVNYPRSAYPGWLDAIIQVDEPYVDFSIHIKPLEPQEVTTRLGRKAIEFRGSVMAAARQGKAPNPGEAIALQDVEKLREKLARGDERIFNISLFVQVRARARRELSERNNRLVSAIRSLDFRALPAHWQHHVGFVSCLPDGDNQLGRSRLFGTSSASTFYPFTGSDIGMESGVMFGMHPSGGLVIINPFNSDVLENANLVVFAKSGAGKSFFLKTTASRLLPTNNVYVIDPEAEYNHLCERVHGQYVRLSSTSLQINPFELYNHGVLPVDSGDVEDGNFFREKVLNLVTLFELLLGDNGMLSQKEKAFLYRCIARTYSNRGITNDPATHSRPAPNMQEFYLILSSEKRDDHRFGVGEDTFGLSERLERYLHIFPSRTRVELTNRFIDFNIRELNESLKPIGLFLITEFLWTRMRQARMAQLQQAHSIVLIDEAWLLMQFAQGAKFLAEFARRIRKYGGGLWCTTQNSDDFLKSDEGKTILAMATMKFLMKQDSSTIESVIQTFRLSPGQRNYLLSARRGEGLFSTSSWSPMQVVASPKESEMANTTVRQASEINAEEELQSLEEVSRTLFSADHRTS